MDLNQYKYLKYKKKYRDLVSNKSGGANLCGENTVIYILSSVSTGYNFMPYGVEKNTGNHRLDIYYLSDFQKDGHSPVVFKIDKRGNDQRNTESLPIMMLDSSNKLHMLAYNPNNRVITFTCETIDRSRIVYSANRIQAPTLKIKQQYKGDTTYSVSPLSGYNKDQLRAYYSTLNNLLHNSTNPYSTV